MNSAILKSTGGLSENNLDFKPYVPHIIKYMGSKRELLSFIVDSINEIYEGESICDLFAGTSILSGAIGHNVNMYSNDIQEYSSVFAKTYLGNYDCNNYVGLHDDIVKKAYKYVNAVHEKYPELKFIYDADLLLKEFNSLEQQQQELIKLDFKDLKGHLFIKNYSGTYWSFDQCLWIDALRNVAEEYSETPVYYPILSSLMFAMAYNAQSTGHYAQYRDANNVDSMNDIKIYRQKEILPYFTRKLTELMSLLGKNNFNHKVTSYDYRECLDSLPKGIIVYADPPYAFVHYSRFYHALETLVKYDYPDVKFKGRYRVDRHQSPFCKKTEVDFAFREMFIRIRNKSAKLVLSYSNTGMISLNGILQIAKDSFGDSYDISTKAIDYTHSTMGRSEDKSREVKEYLIIAKPI